MRNITIAGSTTPDAFFSLMMSAGDPHMIKTKDKDKEEIKGR